MTTDPDHRRRVDEICHEALEREVSERAAFVAAACQGNAQLRRDVESLLSHAHTADQFLAEPIGAVAASVLAGEHGSSLAGRQIGSYKVLSLLGAGGMGDVYRAHDMKLGRDVAIKVVAHAFQSNPDRLARFEREARVLATLNHPHIGAIYGLEEADGIRGLVLELVEGETIVERLATGPMPAREALMAARQIADALEAAHEKGIVHRDLKPGNIKLTADGTVKVLDFGLAKVFAKAGAADDVSQMPTFAGGRTREGVIAGTVAYMSPEQARGKDVDKRTDIWAFGCVLFEMVTGRPAFRGETTSDTLAAILEREPDWSDLPARTPPSIRRLIQRCLDKDPKRRLRDIGDARIDIDDALAPGTAAGVAPSPTVPLRSRRSVVIPGAALLLGLIGGLLLMDRFARTPATLENPLEGATFTRLTDLDGTELDAAISPDGKSVAYVSDRDGQLDVILTQVDSGVFRNITQGKDLELPAPVRATGFWADGSQIWLGGGPRRRLQSVPLMGGAPRPFLSDLVVNIAWSPDGSRLAYHTREAGDPIYLARPDGTDARRLFIHSNPGGHNHFPTWSPDGRWIYFVSGYPATNEMDLWRVDASGGSPPERLTRHDNEVGYPTFIDGRSIVYIARDDNGAGPWLWAFDVERRLTRRVSIGPATYTSVSASADGSRLVASVANANTSLWSVPLLDRLAGESDVKPFVVPTVNAAAPRFADDGALFYRSTGSSGNGLLRFHNGESVVVRRGADAVTAEPPAIAPDKGRVAIALRRNGKLRMHVLSTDGAELRLLSDAIDVAGAASWSPDNKWILTGGSDAKGSGLFKIPIDGGVPERLVTGQALDPIWSPDGKLIVYAGPNVGSQAALIAIRPDGTPADFPEINVRREGGGSRARFLRDGTGLIYMQGTTPAQDFWLLDLATKQTRQLTRLNDQAAMWSFDISPDGKQIVFDRSRDNSQIYVIDLERREQR